MSKTTTTPTTFFGLFNDGYKADDGNGHAGYGSSERDANDALQRAQEKDLEYSEKASITGFYSDHPRRD